MKLIPFKYFATALTAAAWILSSLVSASVNATTPETAPPNAITFERIEEGTLYFNALEPSATQKNIPVNTHLFDLSFIGALEKATPTADSYFLFSAKPCKDCEQDRMIYAVRPSQGKPQGFVYPGKLLEEKNRHLAFKSRAFYGKCLSQSDSVLVFFQEEISDRKRDRPHKMLQSVLVVRPDTNYLKVELKEKNLPRIDKTLHRVKDKQCFEIEGRNRFSGHS